MTYRHAIFHQTSRLMRRYPFLRRLSITPILLALTWLYVLQWGERSSFAAHIQQCNWDSWETWPAGATPHHLVFIADPQLVDPHTYPGRPWPLSSLTEAYTDRYMARNFRHINQDLDPDSVVFLGDLFDGGREWATERARPLKASQRKILEFQGIIAGGKSPEEDGDDDSRKEMEVDKQTKRSVESYKKAMFMPHKHAIKKVDHFLNDRGEDLKEFVHGEDGRWSAWGQTQWNTEFLRFGRIFFETDQLYPGNTREILPAYDVPTSPVAVENGADLAMWREYATSGGKQRQVIASLPGNHDVGFGDGVQLAVRDRFQSHFGDSNRVDIIGNHTFISLDTPSLSASSQFVPEGGETSPTKIAEFTHLWQPTMHFAEDLSAEAQRAVQETLSQYYPEQHGKSGYPHLVTDPEEEEEKPAPKSDVEKTTPQLPVILLSHVPLYRNPEENCGKYRENGNAIAIRAGYQYQNVLTRSLSNNLVNNGFAAGEIVHMFSGDDHDYCDVTHRYNVGKPSNSVSRKSAIKTVKEITVKSFSWAMGVRKPGFQLVSLWNPIDAKGETVGTPLPTVQTHLCLLPDQLGIFIRYAQLLGITLAGLVLRAIIVGLRPMSDEDSDANGDASPTKLVLPRYRPSHLDSSANGTGTPSKTGGETRGRGRAASSSMSTNHNANDSINGNLGVQRSYNARTRTVSPAAGYTPTLPNLQQADGRPLIEKAGYYPQVRWTDPQDESDEEMDIGERREWHGDDSQAKWKRRPRTPSKARNVLKEFGISVMLVGIPAMLYYVWLIRNG